MEYKITILSQLTNRVWYETYDTYLLARKRCIKLGHSRNLDVVGIECDCTDDETELWDYYNYGYIKERI